MSVTEKDIMESVVSLARAVYQNQNEDFDINSVILLCKELDQFLRKTYLAQKKQKPAIDINDSFTDDYIICLEDGKKLKMLKRYLRVNFGLSPQEYREKWDLPADYPMVAKNHLKKRSELAKGFGLGLYRNKK